MSKYDVTALGELLIDFTESGTSQQGNPLLEVNPGGAPCNVLSMLTRLGHTTNFIGKIGRDMFGDLLQDALKEVGIGVDGLMIDTEVNTTLAFVHTAPDGDRDFSFYRNHDKMASKFLVGRNHEAPYRYFLIICTSPPCPNLIMLDGVCGWCSCRRDQQT